MPTPIWIAIAILATGVSYLLVPYMLSIWARFHRPRMVTCPATGRDALVVIDARKAALTAPFHDPLVLEVERCTEWPERQHCAQGCLPRVPN